MSRVGAVAGTARDQVDVQVRHRLSGGGAIVDADVVARGTELAVEIVNPKATALTVTQNGFGKKTPFAQYRIQSRGGKGRITMKVGDKTGGIIGALTVRESDDIMLITVGGQMVRTHVKDIREAGRNTQGVKLINLEEGDRLQAIAPVISSRVSNRKSHPRRSAATASGGSASSSAREWAPD